MRLTYAATALLTLMAAPASAQTTQQSVAVVNAVGQHLWLDTARVDAGGMLYLGGWAFECSSGSQAKTDIVIDGTVTNPNWPLFPTERADVKLWAMTYGICDFYHTPYYSGVNGWVLLSTSGLADGPHAVQIRIQNADRGDDVVASDRVREIAVVIAGPSMHNSGQQKETPRSAKTEAWIAKGKLAVPGPSGLGTHHTKPPTQFNSLCRFQLRAEKLIKSGKCAAAGHLRAPSVIVV